MQKKEAFLLNLSNNLNIPLSCSNDVSFLNSNIYEAHDCLNCIAQNTTLENPKRYKVNLEAYFKSSEEITKFSDKAELIANTLNIAKDVIFIRG